MKKAMAALVQKAKTDRTYLKPTIVQVFLGADLRSGHTGLTAVARKYNIDLPNLAKHQMVVFINRRENSMKTFVTGNTISYTKRDKIDLQAIEKIPEAYGYTGEVDYDRALELSLRARLKAESGSVKFI